MTGLRLMAAGVAIMFGLSASFADAQAAKGKKKGNLNAQFQKLDTNNDNKLSRDEFAKFGKEGQKAKKV